MNQNMENVSDRELFSELFDNPINPLHLHIVPPFVDENNPMFHLHLNGEVALQWRQVYGQPCKVFNLLQRSIKRKHQAILAENPSNQGRKKKENI